MFLLHASKGEFCNVNYWFGGGSVDISILKSEKLPSFVEPLSQFDWENLHCQRILTVDLLTVYLVNKIQFRLSLYFELFDLENFRFGSQKLHLTSPFPYYSRQIKSVEWVVESFWSRPLQLNQLIKQLRSKQHKWKNHRVKQLHTIQSVSKTGVITYYKVEKYPMTGPFLDSEEKYYVACLTNNSFYIHLCFM